MKKETFIIITVIIVFLTANIVFNTVEYCHNYNVTDRQTITEDIGPAGE